MCTICALGAPGVGEAVGQETVLLAINGFVMGGLFYVAKRVADRNR